MFTTSKIGHFGKISRFALRLCWCCSRDGETKYFSTNYEFVRMYENPTNLQIGYLSTGRQANILIYKKRAVIASISVIGNAWRSRARHCPGLLRMSTSSQRHIYKIFINIVILIDLTKMTKKTIIKKEGNRLMNCLVNHLGLFLNN